MSMGIVCPHLGDFELNDVITDGNSHARIVVVARLPS
jgi:hypothetical protein